MVLTPEEKRKMSGQESGEKTVFYKLNEVTMSGDDGKFRLREVLAEKNADGKYNIEDLGETIDGVILKMRWKLSRYDEPNKTFYNSTEYDSKWTDEVMVFPPRDRGSVEGMKEKHKLATQRVLYFYMPKKKQIVRLIVKASALSSEKNPKGEVGLFDYIDEFNETDTLVSDFITTAGSVYRENLENKRKNHYAMHFKNGRPLTDSEKEKVEAMMIEVSEKTKRPTTSEEVAPQEREEEPKDDINSSEIPF